MKFNEFKNQQDYDKVLVSTKVSEFVKLLEDLTCLLSSYTRFYGRIRFSEDKRTQLEFDVKHVEKEIENIYNKIDEFFNEGFFQELTKEQVDEISDEYQYLSEMIIRISIMIKGDAKWQKFTDLINFYQDVIMPRFMSFDESIKIYNKKADENGWKYKLKTFDEAKEYYSELLKMV